MNSVPVILEDATTNWAGYAPDLPGCIATGKTIEETVVRLKEAMRLHLELMREDGDEIPEVFASAFTLDIQIAAD